MPIVFDKTHEAELINEKKYIDGICESNVLSHSTIGN
jgi:hypothetical protein